MKQIFLKSFCARCLTLLILALLSTNLAWGEDITVTVSYSDIPDGFTATTGTSGNFYKTVSSENDLTISYAGINTKSKAEDKDHAYGYAMFLNDNGFIYSGNCPSGYYPSKVTVTYTNGTGTSGKAGISFSSSKLSTRDSNVSGSVSKGGTCVLENDDPTKSFWNFSTKSANVQVAKIEIVYSVAELPAVATPTFTPEKTEFTSEKISVTITCATNDAAIYYTLDGTTPTNASTQYTEAINISETTTIKAIAYYGDDASSVATKTYTKIVPLTTMDAIFSASATKGEYWITFNNWVVSGVKESNAYITDNAGKGLIVYKSGHGFVAGDILSGTVKCALTKYNGSAEITNLTSTTEGLTVTKDGTVTAVNATISELSGVNTGAYINLGELTYDGENFTDGTNEIKPYNTFITLPNLTEGIKYNVKGVYIQFNNTKEIAPLATTDFEKVATTEYNITINSDENGSVTVDAENNKAQAGQVVKLTVAPAEGYKLNTLTVTDASSNPITVTDNEFTMPASNVTISATFVAKAVYNITWMVNGEQYEEISNVTEGETLTLPVAPTPPAGYAFVGWVANEISTPTDTKPTFLADGTVPTASATYYAAFAKETEVDEPKTYSLLPTNFSTNSYSANDGDKEINGITLTIKDVYQTSSSIQMKASSGSLYNKYALGTKITSVVVSIKTNSVKVYEGSANDSWIEVTGSNGTYTFSDNKAYFKVTSTDKYAQVNSITVNYIGKTSVYSNYCTKLASADMAITDAKWGTFCAPFDAAIPEGVKAYTAAASGSEVEFTEVTTTIPAGTPVVVYSATEVDETLGGIATETGETCTSGALVGVYAAKTGITAETGYTNYVLQNNSGVVGFYKATSAISLKANRCYMTLATSAGAKDCIGLDGAVTGINEILNPTKKSVEGIYDLNGRKLAAPQKGINIINGVKVIVK